MNEFIEKNRRLLHFYCVVARIIGWMIVLMGIIQFVSFLSEPLWSNVKWQTLLPYLLQDQNLEFMFGLLVLGTAQFIRYVSEKQYQPGWLLRHGDKFLYLYAFFQIINTIVSCTKFTMLIMARTNHNFSFAEVCQTLFIASLMVLIGIATILILIGLAHILRRILPVIEESKTLV